MKTRVHTLSNGLRIAATEMTDVESVSLVFSAKVGSRNEDIKTNNGVSHLLEHLFFKGTQRRPSTKALTEEIDFLGGSSNAFTSYEITSYYIKIPTKHLPQAVDILADMMQNPIFPADEIDRERGVVLEEMNVVRDDPARHVYDLIPPLIWPGQKLGQDVLGQQEVIKNITRDQILEYKESYYRPENMVVAVSGNFDTGALIKLLENATKGMPEGGSPGFDHTGDKLANQISASYTKETNQAHFIIAGRSYPQLHKKEAATKILSNIFGEGLSSRLFLNVRERKGLAYTVYSGAESFTDSGIFEIYAGVNLEKTNLALEGIFEEIKLITEQEVGAHELQKAKNQLQSRLIIALENNLNVAKRTGAQLLLQGRLRELEEQLKEIETVTKADVQQVAGELLAKDKLRFGIIAPEPQAAQDKFAELVK